MTVLWDERLITRTRAADMCGSWNLKVDNQDHGSVYLRCGQCDGNVLKLPSSGFLVNVDGLIAATVRHMVMSHDYKLSGAPDD